MLKRLVIKNFAIIEDIEINFEDGMNVIMGETGAGKSIIIDALSLLKGEKSSFDKIRNNETKAFIEGEFLINNPLIVDTINAQFGEVIGEDNILVVSRTLDINSKSVVRINMHSSNISSLKQIMELVIDIHSQHKDNSYFDNKKQIEYLDLYINKSDRKDNFNLIKDEYNDLFISYSNEINKLESMEEERKHLDDLDYLQYQFDEINKLDIKEGEVEQVDEDLKSLESFQSLADQFLNFQNAFESASSSLYDAKKSLSLIKDPKFSELIEKFSDLYYQIDDVNDELNSKFNTLSESLSKLDYLRNRKSLFSPLKRKYGSKTSDILNAFEDIKRQIDLLTNYDYLINEQNKIIAEKYHKLTLKGQEVSSLRKEFIPLLEEQINNQLKDLLLENSDFKVNIEEIKPNKYGLDLINFVIRTNIGGKYLPLNETASLGETSRINLAIKNVFNNLNPVETIIFDEIDTGISGKAASATSNKIKEISTSSQTIVISHLAQMASRGDHHYLVKKIVENNTTKTKVNKLTLEQTIKEIGIMITGNDDKEAIKLAKSMIDNK